MNKSASSGAQSRSVNVDLHHERVLLFVRHVNRAGSVDTAARAEGERPDRVRLGHGALLGPLDSAVRVVLANETDVARTRRHRAGERALGGSGNVSVAMSVQLNGPKILVDRRAELLCPQHVTARVELADKGI